jgi:hypothetical protein
MSLKFDWVAIDCHDPKKVAAFWEGALPDYRILPDDTSDPDDDEVLLLPEDRRGPKLLFLKVPDGKKVKNRLHFDLRPETDRDTEVTRLEGLGAKKVDIGQGSDVTWTVMADVEGNEFCVLRALSDEEKEKYADWAW